MFSLVQVGQSWSQIPLKERIGRWSEPTGWLGTESNPIDPYAPNHPVWTFFRFSEGLPGNRS
jgi:hypothetical protein